MRYARFLEVASNVTPAVVLQSSFANALGIIRGLGAERVPVLAVDKNPRALGFVSRYAAARLCPDPLDSEERFVAFLEELGAELPQPAVLFPTHDEYIWPVSRHADRLRRVFRIPFADWPAMRRLADKEEQLRAAWRAGVDTPLTAFVRSSDDLAVAVSTVPFPAIFKPAESLAFKQRFGRPVLEIPSAALLDSVYERVADCGPLMLQEIVPGPDDELYTVGSYLDVQSRPLAVFTGRKLRQHPRRFGTARFAESVWIEELADAGLRLLGELGYHGVSQVEFKRDPRDGRYKLMEVNARHWLWHSLATACGVNFSYVAYRDAVGEPFLAPRQQDRRRWILALKDVPDSVREAARRDYSPLDWLASLRGIRADGVFAVDDPRPGFVASLRLVRLAWTRWGQRRERGGRADEDMDL